MVENTQKSDSDREVVLDARPLGRYEGTVPEPRPKLSSGHMPHSLPNPSGDYLLPASDGKPYTSYKPLPQLKAVLVDAVGKDRWAEVEKGDRGLVFTCGSGMTASVGWLANEMIKVEEGGRMKTAIYDEVSEEEAGGASFVADVFAELDGVCESGDVEDRQRAEGGVRSADSGTGRESWLSGAGNPAKYRCDDREVRLKVFRFPMRRTDSTPRPLKSIELPAQESRI